MIFTQQATAEPSVYRQAAASAMATAGVGGQAGASSFASNTASVGGSNTGGLVIG